MFFVNAKINIGLQIVGRRPDGYHDLQTVFYPIGKEAGKPENPVRFCDILELAPLTSEYGENPDSDEAREGALPRFLFKGREIECPLESNLVYKASSLFCEATGADFSDEIVILEKCLPDGAGLGGGSADAAFTLLALAEKYNATHPGKEITRRALSEMALKLGADCPFFILNQPAYAEGVGEELKEIGLNLSGYWLVLIKPDIYVSTREAFAGVTPRRSDFDLRQLPSLPIEEWREKVKNDFEDSLFPRYPLLEEIKEKLYKKGALYASMSGSGSSIYGMFRSKGEAEETLKAFEDDATIEGSYLLKM